MRTLPNDKADSTQPLLSVEQIGRAIQQERKAQGLTQSDIAGLAQTGVRFIVDLEKGKPTIQMSKALAVLQLLGLELVVRKKGAQ